MTEATRIALSRLTLAPNVREVDRQVVVVVNEYGDTELHRLLASHTSMEQVEGFLQQQYFDGNTVASCIPSILCTNVDGINALHVAVFRNGYHVQEIVRRLLECNELLARTQVGDSHMYALHIALAYSLTIETAVIDMLLEANGTAATIRNADGASPLDLLTFNVQRFRWAHSEAPTLECKEQRDYAYMTIISPVQYKDIGIKLLKSMGEKFSWHLVAKEAPVLLLRILLQEQTIPGFWHRDASGQYPLHCARSREAAELLLQYAGSTMNQADDLGRWPLHQNPDSLVLALDAPEALGEVDPNTGLFPFQLATDFDMIYTLLRMNPSVIQCRT